MNCYHIHELCTSCRNTIIHSFLLPDLITQRHVATAQPYIDTTSYTATQPSDVNYRCIGPWQKLYGWMRCPLVVDFTVKLCSIRSGHLATWMLNDFMCKCICANSPKWCACVHTHAHAHTTTIYTYLRFSMKRHVAPSPCLLKLWDLLRLRRWSRQYDSGHSLLLCRIQLHVCVWHRAQWEMHGDKGKEGEKLTHRSEDCTPTV